MNAKGYYEELTGIETVSPPTDTVYTTILNTTLPHVFNANLRHSERKVWAKEVRAMFKAIGLTGISVTTPNYSMADTISIRINRPDGWNEIHHPEHMRLEEVERAKAGPYCGMVQVCPFCKLSWEAKKYLEKIVLAAFPDLNDRSDYQQDYYDYCFSVD